MKLKLLYSALVFSAITANAQLATIDENFETFTAGPSASWPQNGWSKVLPSGMGPMIYTNESTDKYIQFYSLVAPNIAGYLVTPQIVVPDGTKSLTFTYGMTNGSAGTGTLEVGLVTSSSTAGVEEFTSISPVYSLDSTTEQTVTITVPASASQYIAFKFIGNADHSALSIDDVKYNVGNLSTANYAKSTDSVKFSVNSDNTLLYFTDKTKIKNIDIFSSTGQRVATGKLNNDTYNISDLNAGVYYITIETRNGKVIKSKFIKK